MAIHPGASASSNLVDLSQGTISREVFVNSSIYQQEQEQVFARSWLFVGHESQIPSPGDYFVSSMGEESVIMCRDRQGQIHVFLNTCMHRGMKVCRYDEGNTAVFTCPYHGWSYATDGQLVGVPYFKEAYREQLDKSQWGLIEVPQLANYKGTVWANWDASAPNLTDYLGDMKTYLDTRLGRPRRKRGRLRNPYGHPEMGHTQQLEVRRRELLRRRLSQHQPPLRRHGRHRPQPAATAATPTSVTPPSASAPQYPEGGHGALSYWQAEDIPYSSGYQNHPVVDEYFRHCYEERKRRMGKDAGLLGSVGTVFPNASYLARQPRSIAVWHPRGAMKTEAWRWFLVDKDAPNEVKEILRHYYMRYSGPAGMTEQDDMENWNYASAASKGVIARRYPYNYQMGMGYEGSDVPLPGLVTPNITEQNQRNFYKRWAEYMDADNWEDLLTPNGSHTK